MEGNRQSRKRPIIILLIFAIAFFVLSFVFATMAQSNFDAIMQEQFLLRHLRNSKMIFLNINMILLCVLMLIYTVKFKDSTKGNLFLSLVYAGTIQILLFDFVYGLMGLGYFSFDTYFLSIFIVPAFVVAMICGFKDKANKIFIIIACSLIFLSISISMCQNAYNLVFNVFSIYQGTWYLCAHDTYRGVLFYNVGSIFFYLSVLFLAVKRKNTVQEPQVAQEFAAEPQVARALTPEQELVALREQFELGIISEEEYLSRRAEVVKTL